MEDNFGRTLPRRMPSTRRPQKPWEVSQPPQPEETDPDELLQAEREATESLEDVVHALESVKERLKEEDVEAPRASVSLPAELLRAKAMAVHLEGDRLILGYRKDEAAVEHVRPLCYVETEASAEELELLKLHCLEQNGRAFLLDEEARVLARVFGKDLRCPLRRGLIDAGTTEALAVLEEELKALGAADARVLAVVVPEVPPEEEVRLRFHQEMLKEMLESARRRVLVVTATEAAARNVPARPQRVEAIIHMGNHWTGAGLAFAGMMGKRWGIAGGLEDILENAARITGTSAQALRASLLGDKEPERAQIVRLAAWTCQSEILETLADGLSKRAGEDWPEQWDGVVTICGEGAMLPDTSELMWEVMQRRGLSAGFKGVEVARDPLVAPVRGAVVLAEAVLRKEEEG